MELTEWRIVFSLIFSLHAEECRLFKLQFEGLLSSVAYRRNSLLNFKFQVTLCWNFNLEYLLLPHYSKRSFVSVFLLLTATILNLMAFPSKHNLHIAEYTHARKINCSSPSSYSRKCYTWRVHSIVCYAYTQLYGFFILHRNQTFVCRIYFSLHVLFHLIPWESLVVGGEKSN